MNDKPNRRILVIDDNRAIHEDFRKILCGSGTTTHELSDIEKSLFGDEGKSVSIENFEMDFAFQGEEGVKCVEQAIATGRPYALAFVDVRMPPGLDGVETTAKIWKRDPDLQVVMCTAYSDYSWEEMAEKIGQSDKLVILKKPFDNIEVLQLAQALSQKWGAYRTTKAKIE